MKRSPNGVGKRKASHSHKTAKRLEIKRQMKEVGIAKKKSKKK